MESVDERKKSLEQWLSTLSWLKHDVILPMQGDASFRRYFRVSGSEGSYVAMDAPPLQENCYAYVAIAHALRTKGLNAPEIIANDFERGFLLITDYGDTTYLKALNIHNADQFYQRALNALAVLQGCRDVPGRIIPAFNQEFMMQEWQWHKEWVMDKWLGLSLGKMEQELDECYLRIVEQSIAQPQVFMHRDYHSANLMVMTNDVAILDFQDAFIGPVTYDLVSLLRDCYIDWPDERVMLWVSHYWQLLTELGVLNNVTQEEFSRWFDWMGVQRHLKAMLTFARKKVRDNQPNYLKFIPRTLNYLQQVSYRYQELAPMTAYLEKVKQKCVQ